MKGGAAHKRGRSLTPPGAAPASSGGAADAADAAAAGVVDMAVEGEAHAIVKEEEEKGEATADGATMVMATEGAPSADAVDERFDPAPATGRARQLRLRPPTHAPDPPTRAASASFSSGSLRSNG